MNEIEMTMNDIINTNWLIAFYNRANKETKKYIRNNYNKILNNYSIIIW